MEFKEIKKELVSSEHAEWFKTVEIGFSSYPCNFHEKFVGIESFYQFLEKEVSEWKELENNDLPFYLNRSRQKFSSLFSELHSSLVSLTESRISVTNLILKNSEKVNEFQKQIYLSKSPVTSFLINLHNLNKISAKGANRYLTDDLSYPNWSEDKNEIMGVLAAYEFSSSEHSQLFSRRMAEKKSFSKLRRDFDKVLDEIISIKETKSSELEEKIRDFEQSINEIRTRQNNEHHQAFSSIEEEHNRIHLDATKRIAELESLYADKLMLEKPAEFWDKRATELKKSANKWMFIAFLSALAGLALFTILAMSLSLTHIEQQIKNPAISIRWSILSILAIALIVFLVRTFTKLTMSTYHLYRDSQERKQLTYLYLTLSNKTEIPDADRHIILQSLFSRSDTGLLKEDSGPTMPISVLDKINR